MLVSIDKIAIKKKAADIDPCFKTCEGFEKIYNLYATKMYQIGCSQLEDAEVTKEIVQEIFKSLWERKHSLEVKGSIENYLMKALKYRVIDHFRAETSKDRLYKKVLSDYSDEDYYTDNELAFNELKSRVDILVSKLSPQCRKTYEMSREKGFSNKEIASSLSISQRAVAYHLATAISLLRDGLHDCLNPSRSAS